MTTRQRPTQLGARARRIATRCTAEPDEIDEGTHNEDSLDDEAKASVARKAYAARAAANDDEAHARGHSGTTHGQGRRHRRRGSDGDEAAESAARRGYASAAFYDDEASAPTARRARAANSAPMHGRGRRD